MISDVAQKCQILLEYRLCKDVVAFGVFKVLQKKRNNLQRNLSYSM